MYVCILICNKILSALFLVGINNNGKSDVVFLVDSASISNKKKFRKTLAFIKDYVSDANIDHGDVRVGLIISNQKNYVRFYLNQFSTKHEVLDALEVTSYKQGRSNLAESLKIMRNQVFSERFGDRADAPNFALLLLNNQSHSTNSDVIDVEFDLAQKEGIHIFAFDIEPTHTAPKYAFQKFGDCSDAQLDLVFVLDSSTSVGRANFRILLSFVKSLLSDVPINNEGVQVGILSFSNDVRIHFRLNDYNNKEELLAAIDSIPFRHGSANLAEAIRIMHEDMFHGRNGDRENVANIAVIITDGLSNLNSYRLPNAVRNAKNKEIKMYAIGIGLTDTRELDLIATHPILKNRITVPKFGQLLDIKSTLLKNLCPVIIPEAPPQGVQKTIPTDLIFLVDSSTSVGQRNFQKFIDYIKSFVSEADIDYGSVRIGLALYSTRVYIQFYLNDFLSKSEMLDAIDNIRYRYGSTNAAHMFRTLRNKMFTPENGDRPDARNIAIVITDGISNIEHYQTVPQARLTHAANIHVYAIGFKLYDTRELIQICSSPAKENAFTVESLDEIEFLKDKILEKIAPATTEPPTEPTVPTTTPTTTVTTTIPTTTAEYIAVPSDIVFMVDSSTSVSRQNFKKVLGFIKHFLADADIENDVVHVGIATYSTNVFIQFNLNAYTTKEEIFNAIDNIPYRYGSTNIAHAFRTMRTRMFTPENGDRPEARNIAFLITDGVSNIEHYQTIPQAELAHDANIHVYAIGIGLYDTKELEGLSSKPSQENTFILQDFNELDFLKNDLFEKIYPEPPTTPPEPEFAPSDIIFLLDTSTSVNEGNFKKVLAFVKDFLAEAHFGPDGIRIGIVTYSTSINVQFYLNTYETKKEILEAIDNIPYTYGSTNTAGGLETIRKVMFQKERGDREDAKNIAIVVTDGVSNVNAYRTVDEAALVKKENIHIYAIGVGLVELSELHQIVSEPPEENTFLAQNFDELQGLKELVFTEFQPKCIAASYDLAFLLDSSTSVSERNFKRVLTFVKEFLSTAVIGPDAIHVSIVTFSTHVRIEFLLNRYTSKEEIFEAIDRIPYRYGSTNTADGLKTIRSEIFRIESGDRPEAQNRLFVITDGVSNINSFRTIDEAELTKNQDIHIYAIGIGLPDTNELMKIASEPSEENTLIVREFNDLKGLQAEMFKEICLGMPTRKPRPTEPPTRPPVSVRGRCRAAKADIVFVLDSSTSVSQINFKNIQKFMKEFLTDATISLEAVRVGAIVYSTSVNIQFHLSDYSNKEDVFRAIDSIQYTYGSTNTADALKVMRTEMFAAENGDREDVQNIAVVVTDGVSNINSYNTVTEAELAKNDGIHIYAIGVGLSDSRELNRIASHPATENTFEVQDFDELHGVRTKVFKEFCPESCISTSTDIIFLMDTSTSVEQRNFKKMVAFIKDLLSNATIDAGVVRVGVATFSTQSHIEFHLNEYFTKNEIFTALDKIRYRYGNTNTAGALHTMRARMFTPEHGDRESAIDVAILITDGISNMNTNRISIEAKAAHKRGIQVYAIGIGLAEISELKQSASQPSEDYTFNVQDFHELQNLKGKLFEFCDLGKLQHM
uniref:VWFA domain-containing protein n=1 Tax=Octopus bimaculoides TaxID=37653 RepID=A0A0L8FLC0_OCTBM